MLMTRSYTKSSAFLTRLAKQVSGLSLSDFLLRQQALELWRNVIRTVNKIPKDSSARSEMRKFAKEEFERNRSVTDPIKIRYLVSTGRTQLDEISKAIK